MNKPLCLISGCDGIAVARGWCKLHYTRWLRHGHPLATHADIGPRTLSDADRFWSKVDRSAGADRCWLWTGHIDKTGYGWHGIKKNGKRRGGGAHRFAYEFTVGPIPDGMTLDHLCRNTSCVNPAHLEPVPVSTNLKRRHFYENLAKTTCPHGHVISEENTGVRANGTTYCRVCQKNHARAYRVAHGATPVPMGQPWSKGKARLSRPLPTPQFH